MRAEFVGRVASVKPNNSLLGANGDALSYSVGVECGGGSRQGATVMVRREEAAEWDGRKVRVAVETIEEG